MIGRYTAGLGQPGVRLALLLLELCRGGADEQQRDRRATDRLRARVGGGADQQRRIAS